MPSLTLPFLYTLQAKWYQWGFLFSVLYLAVWVFVGGAWWKVGLISRWLSPIMRRGFALKGSIAPVAFALPDKQMWLRAAGHRHLLSSNCCEQQRNMRLVIKTQRSEAAACINSHGSKMFPSCSSCQRSVTQTEGATVASLYLCTFFHVCWV